MNPSTGSHGGVNLPDLILAEITPAFRESSSPQVSEDQVRSAVRLLIKLLAHRVGDANLDAVGGEIQRGLTRWFANHELVKVADRYEPFCKFVLRLVHPAKFAELKRREQSSDPKERPGASYVLKAKGLDIVSNKEMELFANESWESFPLVALQGQPNFLVHIARTYVFRNVDDHRARVLNQREKAQIAESFCVFLVWTVFKFGQELEDALIVAQFSGYLQKIRNLYASIGTSYVELLSEPRSGEEYRFPDQPASVMDGLPADDAVPAPNLPIVHRVVVIEAEPGAGKTTTLQFIAWQHTTGLLAGERDGYRVPLYLDLKLLNHRGQTIEAAVARELEAAGVSSEIPWHALLLLVDGLNEVTTDSQMSFKKEIQTLLADFSHLRAVIAGRPNSFRSEFAARIVVLRRLSNPQLQTLFRNQLGDDVKATTLLAAVRRSPFLRSWARTPLHACLIARTAQHGDLSSLASHAQVVRRCVRDFLLREEGHASATVSRTGPETKGPLLARLAFETKSKNESVFSQTLIRSVFSTAKAQIGATSLDIPALPANLWVIFSDGKAKRGKIG